MHVGAASQQVVVTDAPPPLQTQSSSLGQVIDTQEILDLPTNGRNSYSFATLVPGVLAGPGFSSLPYDEYSDQFVSINGSRPNQSLFLIDGGINSEPAFNGPGYSPSIDMVQQYKVQTNNFSAEFSNTAGGIINVITKSGSNASRYPRTIGSRSNVCARSPASSCRHRRRGVPLSAESPVPRGPPAGAETVLRLCLPAPRARSRSPCRGLRRVARLP